MFDRDSHIYTSNDIKIELKCSGSWVNAFAGMKSDREAIIKCLKTELNEKSPSDDSLQLHLGNLLNIRLVKPTNTACTRFLQDGGKKSLIKVFDHFNKHTTWRFDTESGQMRRRSSECLWPPGTDFNSLYLEYKQLYGLFPEYKNNIISARLQSSIKLSNDRSEVTDVDSQQESGQGYSMKDAFSHIL
eukprot:707826_1